MKPNQYSVKEKRKNRSLEEYEDIKELEEKENGNME